MIVQQARRHVLCSLLVLAFAMLLPVWATAAPTAITVQRQITVDKLPADEFILMELVDAAQANVPVLTVTWGKGESVWLPVWNVQLTSGAGVIASGQHAGSQVTPKIGHTYDITLSYDAAAGVVSFRMFDETAGENVARLGLRIALYDGAIDISDAMQSAGIVRVSPSYEPVHIIWDAGVRSDGGFIPLRTLEPAEPIVIRLRGNIPVPGDVRLVTGDGVVLASGNITPGDTYLEVPPYTMPVGVTDVSLLFVYEDQDMVLGNRLLHIGRITGGAKAVFNRDSNQIDAKVTLTSDSLLTNVAVQMQGTLVELLWDAAEKKYRERMVSTREWHFGDMDISAVGTDLNVTIPAPEKTGVWRLDFSAHTDPAVQVQFGGPDALLSTYLPAQVAPGEPYTIAIFPDTQYYTMSYPDIYMRMAEWLSARAADERIAFALHVGDITNDNTPDQWLAARNAHSLMDGVVPYVPVVGNHDYAPNGLVAERNTSQINRYFPAVTLPNLSGMMDDGRIENAYYTFHVGDTSYMVLSLEFAPPNEVLAWANDVVEHHPEHAVIVVTHGYLHPTTQRLAPGASAAVFPMGNNPNTTMNDGEDMWHKFVRKHKNIRIVLSGHIHSDAIPYRFSLGDHGNRVMQLLVNYQAGERGGNGFIVLLDVSLDGTVTARAYSPYLGEDKRGVDRYGNVVPVTLNVDW